MSEAKKSITLYDAGGLIILITIFGIPFGSIFDYLWNLLVFSVALPFLPAESKIKLSKGRRFLYILLITILGIIIDWAYFELTWDTHFGKDRTMDTGHVPSPTVRLDAPASDHALAGQFRTVILVLEDGEETSGCAGRSHGSVHRSLAIAHGAIRFGLGSIMKGN